MTKQFDMIEVRIYPSALYFDNIAVAADTLADILSAKRMYDKLGKKYVCKFICGSCSSRRVEEVKQAFSL